MTDYPTIDERRQACREMRDLLAQSSDKFVGPIAVDVEEAAQGRRSGMGTLDDMRQHNPILAKAVVPGGDNSRQAIKQRLLELRAALAATTDAEIDAMDDEQGAQFVADVFIMGLPS